MPQISKNPVHKDVYYSIRDDFLWILASLQTTAEVKDFFYDFFTKTERIMLAKRLAIAMMIHEGFQYQDIKFILHVSTATISRVASWMDHGGSGVERALDKLIKEEHAQVFWKKVNYALDRFMRLRK